MVIFFRWVGSTTNQLTNGRFVQIFPQKKVSVKEFLRWLKHSGSTRAAALSRVSLGERRGTMLKSMGDILKWLPNPQTVKQKKIYIYIVWSVGGSRACKDQIVLPYFFGGARRTSAESFTKDMVWSSSRMKGGPPLKRQDAGSSVTTRIPYF